MKTIKFYRKFNAVLVITTCLPMLLVGAVNIFIDPYEIFDSFKIKGVNYIKPEKFKQDRLYKAVKITKINPKTILLGSSQVQWGLPPDHPALPEATYNLGLLGANIYELRRYFEHVLANQTQLEQVIIGIDFFMFSTLIDKQSTFKENILEKNSLPISEFANIVFSIDSFEDSYNTYHLNQEREAIDYLVINNMLKLENRIFKNGGLAFHKNSILPGSKDIFYQFVKRDLSERNQYKLSHQKMEDFSKIIQKARENNIQVKIFISPIHAVHLETLDQAGLWPQFEDWKRKITKISSVWDFATYNKITTEKISNNMQYFLDSAHYSQQAGTLILNRILLDKSDKYYNDFGTVMTDSNIDGHLKKIRNDKTTWASNNLNYIQVIQEIQHNINKKKHKPSQ